VTLERGMVTVDMGPDFHLDGGLVRVID
jgi:hypothetical protein